MKMTIAMNFYILIIFLLTSSFEFEDFSIILHGHYNHHLGNKSIPLNKESNYSNLNQSDKNGTLLNFTAEYDENLNKSIFLINGKSSDESTPSTKAKNPILCEQIQKVLFAMLDVDNKVSRVRESFLNHSKVYLNFTLGSNHTEEEINGFKENENKIIEKYINDVNSLSGLIHGFKIKLEKLKKIKCGEPKSSLDSKVEDAENNLKSLIQLVGQEVKDLNLPVSFIAIA
jgi:hypothetical protein